jgi:YgiT-type zinc finger domain-containing protein
MKCMYCQALMTRQPAPFHITRPHYHLTLETVPAWVCSQCGEVYFETSDVATIQQVIELLEVVCLKK